MSGSTTAGLRLAGTLAAAVLGSTVLTGCGELFSEPAHDTSCAWLSDTDPAEKAGHTVILVDRSASVEGGETPDYVKALDDIVRAAVKTHDIVSIGTFDGSAATVRLNAEALVTDRGKENPELRRADDKTATRCLLSSLREAVGADARTPGTDVMGALTMSGRVLRDTRGPKKVVVATDGLSTTGCTDLTHASISDHRAIEPIRQLCDQTVPKDSLSGVAATLVGIGHPAAGQPQPSSQQLEWLGSLWATLCENTGAKPCKVSTEPVPVADGRRETTQDDPRITFPPPEHGVRQPDGSTRYQVDSQVLFAPNDATISADGRDTLTTIANEIAGNGTGVVTVDGYTEAQASPEANRGLAQARANEVRGFLTGSGIDVTNAVGHSETAPDCAPSDRQCKRRVDIVFSPTLR
jgi:OOP family OmpA-OmpF porin